MSREFHRNDITITRYWSGLRGAMFKLHGDEFAVDELPELITLLRSLYRREKGIKPKKRRRRIADEKGGRGGKTENVQVL